MPFDALTMAAVRDEIESATLGGRIQKILQPSEASIALSVYGRQGTVWIVGSAEAAIARVHLSSTRLAKGFATPSPFIMLLRKHIEGARIAGVESPSGERLLFIRCGEPLRGLLTFEIMGRHSNIILVDGSERVLGAVKTVTARQSAVRPIMPGTLYASPPTVPPNADLYPLQTRLNPATEPEACRAWLASLQGDVTVARALSGLLVGAGPFLVRQIALKAGTGVDEPMTGVDPNALVSAAVHFYDLYASRAWNPSTFVDERGRRDFAPFMPAGLSEVEPAGSTSRAIESVLGDRENRDPLAASRAATIGGLTRRMRSLDARLASLQRGLAASSGADEVMQQGQLILAYSYSLGAGATQLDIPELNSSIELDPRATPQANAERYFRRYRKLRDAAARIPALIDSTLREREALADQMEFARFADSDAALSAVRRDAGIETQPSGVARAARPRGPARYRLGSFLAVAGRSATENDEVTFRTAARDDLWLHARGRTGSHVVLRAPSGQTPDEEVVLAAAGLAAYLSSGRNDTAVDVDVTAVRNVRKLPKGPPGRVTYAHYQTMRVQPDRGGWVSEARQSR